MKFDSEIERMQHPLASLIPNRLWLTLFNSEIYDDNLSLMQADESNLMEQMEALHTYFPYDDDKQMAWISIALSHPALSASLLVTMGEQLGLSHASLLRAVCAIGAVNVAECLKERYAEERGMLREIIVDNKHAGFRLAVSQNQRPMMEWVMANVPREVRFMICTEHYGACRAAVAWGELALMQRMMSFLDDTDVEFMLKDRSYVLYTLAAEHGHLEMLRYLEELVVRVSPNKFGRMVRADNFSAFRYAARNNHLQVVNYLLQSGASFPYAEEHEREYGEGYVYPFITEQLRVLRVQKIALQQTDPNAVFNITVGPAKLCFYFLRSLIRRCDDALLDDIRFLLDIPAVKALVHTSENELLRLALAEGNEAASALLLNIPVVSELAEDHDYYRDEIEHGLGIETLIRDRESSMRGLTVGEARRLEAVIARYQPVLREMGVPQVMMDLKETLKRRYEARPALMIRDDEETPLGLPMQWDDFQAQALSETELNRAFKAYYEHKDHTAFRYLSKPNPWMHASATHVYVDQDNPGNKWSTFEEYQSLITMLYLAAIDTDALAAPCDDHTLETRLECFIHELAYIGRAHNWDHTRERAHAMEQFEEYDDLEADRPSCYSGVKRRLFQSVLGHPLLKVLTKEVIESEIRKFVLGCVKASLTPKHQAAWRLYIETLDQEALAILKQLDITDAKRDAWIENLTARYGASLTEEPAFTRQIQQAFQLNDQTGAHAVNFGGFLRNVFESDISQTETLGRVGIFAAIPGAAASSDPDTLKKDESNTL